MQTALPHAAPVSDRRARPARDRRGDRGELLHPFRGHRARRALRWPDPVPARLRRSMRASSISCSGCTPRSGASPRCPTCSTSSAPRPCSRSRCWCSTTSWCRRRSTAQYFFGKITIVLYWFLQMAFLAGSRIAYRQFRYVRTQQHVRGEHSVPTLVLGRAADAEVLLARDRERGGEPRASGRHPVAVARRPRPVDARHSGGRQPRRSRTGGARLAKRAARISCG